MDGNERSAGHAVLQARPRRTPEGAPSAWEPLVERADVPPEREDLRPRQVEPRRLHVRPPHSVCAGLFFGIVGETRADLVAVHTYAVCSPEAIVRRTRLSILTYADIDIYLPHGTSRHDL